MRTKSSMPFRLLRRPRTLVGGVLVAFAALLVWQPSYDVNNSNYDRLSAQFQQLREKDESVSPAFKAQIDLSQVNGGQWTKVCLFGPYTSPLDTISRERLQLTTFDYLRFAGLIAHSPFRISIVEEREAMLLYVDLKGITNVLHFESGLPNYPYLSDCIEKPQTIMVL